MDHFMTEIIYNCQLKITNVGAKAALATRRIFGGEENLLTHIVLDDVFVIRFETSQY